MVEDRGAVLGTGVAALAVLGGGVVHFVEEFEEGGVGEGGRVVGDLDGFGVCVNGGFKVSRCNVTYIEAWKKAISHTSRPATTNSSITRVAHVPANIPHPRLQ